MVKAWKEQVTIPTYEIGHPEKVPVFLENRVYQGSSGVVYPYPVIESIADKPSDKTYQAVYIENEYIKVMILPELGGRVQMAYDKIKQRHFIYYNQVIKPALVGLAGPWISGGIEFNWPQHHRPSTFMPVDCTIEEQPDGSVTVWVNERERMFHQQAQAGFTLYPGCAYLEIKGRLYNPTETPQTFLWWANPAVFVNDQYQSVFPPDVHAVFDHGKRAVSSFPVATGTYYKMDYSAGVDISNYRNIPVPTSYMVARSKYNFEGGYENDTRAGMLHVADHHVSPGKKQWTWGNGDFGRAWDRNLTDEDGPYIELMAGVYTENQPDFSWLMPYEEKTFVQYFLPYRELGIVKNASKDLLINVLQDEKDPQRLHVKIFATRRQQVLIRLTASGADGVRELYHTDTSLSPEQIFDTTIDIGQTPFSALRLDLIENGRSVLSWMPEPDTVTPLPDAAEAALLPADIKTNEQLYLTGLHLEQYRHATWSATDYYLEALRRDPADVRCNNAIGLWYIRRGRFAKAEPYLRTAVKVLQKRNLNPYDGEPLYNLALSLKYQGKYDEAYDWFYKSTWNAAWQDAGYFACAQISVMRGDWQNALWEIDHALVRNWHNHKARALKAHILRQMGRQDEAPAFIADSLKINPFNYGCMYEQYQAQHDEACLSTMQDLMRGDANNYDELALDYAAAGCWEPACAIWTLAATKGAVTPLTLYYKAWAWYHLKMSQAVGPLGEPLTEEQMLSADGNRKQLQALLDEALAQTPDYCFPNRAEAVLCLDWVKRVAPEDAHAPYFLGNLYYNARQYDLALANWELSASLDPSYPVVHRNLALIYYNKPQVVCGAGASEGEIRARRQEALRQMEQAYALDESDSRMLMEYDQLCKSLQCDHLQRLERLQAHPEVVAQRDDLILEEITLLNMTGAYREAMTKLDAHTFHPWEGGEGKVPAQYQISRVELARQAIAARRYAEAVELLRECLEYPHHLGEGKLFGAQENDFYYYMGCAFEGLGDMQQAKACWEKAVNGPTEPAAALYYNDAKPDKIFYQGAALRKLHRDNEANGRFYKLVNFGEQHLFDDVHMDYFAVSLPDLQIWDGDLNIRNRVHCNYMLALGHYGLGHAEQARKFLAAAAELDRNHQGIMAFDKFMAQA